MMRGSWLTLIVRVTVASVIALFAIACSVLDSDSSSSSSGASGASAPTKGVCYIAKDKGRCECVAKSEDSTRPAADWSKVDACNETTVGKRLACDSDTKVDGSTTTCGCTPLQCKKHSGDYPNCRCDASGEGDDTTECTGSEWYCAQNDGSSCYGGNGSFGSACANEESTVTGCKLSDLKPTSDQKTSCDGLSFVAQ
jgi:hypothetical protein